MAPNGVGVGGWDSGPRSASGERFQTLSMVGEPAHRHPFPYPCATMNQNTSAHISSIPSGSATASLVERAVAFWVLGDSQITKTHMGTFFSEGFKVGELHHGTGL